MIDRIRGSKIERMRKGATKIRMNLAFVIICSECTNAARKDIPITVSSDFKKFGIKIKWKSS